MNEMVYLNVPQPLHNIDAELNLMATLEWIMRHADQTTTLEERERVAEWFTSRYGNEN